MLRQEILFVNRFEFILVPILTLVCPLDEELMANLKAVATLATTDIQYSISFILFYLISY